MEDSLDSNSLKEEVLDKESKAFLNSKITEIHPLAFTIEFDDQKFDESKKSKVQERLSAFTLKHRRNPSLPDFREFKNGKNCSPSEKIISPVNSQHVPVLHKRIEKFGKPSEIQWKSTALKATKNIDFKTPISVKPNMGKRDDIITSLKAGRRYSLDAIEDGKTPFPKVNDNNEDNAFEKGPESKRDDAEMKSDTVSEAGTYTVDKEEEEVSDANRTCVLDDKENGEFLNETNENNHSSWINDWVRDVEKQNLLNPAPKESPAIFSRHLENGTNPNRGCKIPSPINTLTRKAKPRSVKPGQDAGKLNGSPFHRRSSSLSAKDCNDNHGSESSLETESFLRTTESVMTSLHHRMKLSLERRSPELRSLEKRNFNYKERPHPPSTASDTGSSNSENDGKSFKKPIGNPFTSARLNRAFSLRRAKADPEKDSARVKHSKDNELDVSAKQDVISKSTPTKPPSSIPFSRLDCGRFSMRSTTSGIRTNNWGFTNQTAKKETPKKSNGGNRSTSSLSSREVEFQNWRRRKSFDPMKSAAEGRKKELAKKAAVNHSMTQSVTLGSGSRIRGTGGNPVLRSASFHSTAQVLGNEADEVEEFQERGSAEEQESAPSSFPNYYSHSRPHNSPSQRCVAGTPATKTPIFSSRNSLVSETHSSPSRRLRSNDLENLVLSAINEASFKLKQKSCRLLKKLNYMYDPDEEKSLRLRNEIAVLESGQNSSSNSPVHKATSRDLSAILKNLRGVENVFNVLEEVLFSENLEIYIKE